jgi:hypothetical protein
MKLTRLILVLLAGLLLAGVAYVNQATTPAAVQMADAAEKFLASLKADQKQAASFAFDDKERLNWHFMPLQDKDKKSTRKGVPLEKMTQEQKTAALQLVKAGTSAKGYVEATTVMALEGILNELEKGGAMVRNPDWYFFSVFGTPSKTGEWGWRVEGHHLSLNFTLNNGQVVSSTPAFFGANPAIVMSGDKKGQKTLAQSQELAKNLYEALDADQKKVALQDKQFPEIAGKATAPKTGEPVGLAGAKMNDKQKELLWNLIQSYADRLAPDLAAAELAQVKKDGLDKVYFGIAGSTEPGKGYTYRVHGPSFVIEFINLQADSAGNPANHIHSAWRKIGGDFGLAAK